MLHYLPNFIPNNIIIYGVGGTGSRLVPLIAQFVKTCSWVIDPLIFLVDFDRVEEKNLLRQNFVVPDVDKFKAEVLANRYSKAFGVNIFPITEKVTKNNYSSIWPKVENRTHPYSNSLHVLCVDSPDARREILEGILKANSYYGTSERCFILDSGNENDFGQVVISNGGIIRGIEEKTLLQIGEIHPAYPISGALSSIPLDFGYFDSMVAETETSCADLDQTMAINCMMATTLFSVIQNIYYCKPISYHRLNVSLSHGTTVDYITPKWLTELSKEKFSNTVWGSNILEVSYAIYVELFLPDDFFSEKNMEAYRSFTLAMEEMNQKSPIENIEEITKKITEDKLVDFL